VRHISLTRKISVGRSERGLSALMNLCDFQCRTMHVSAFSTQICVNLSAALEVADHRTIRDDLIVPFHRRSRGFCESLCMCIV